MEPLQQSLKTSQRVEIKWKKEDKIETVKNGRFQAFSELEFFSRLGWVLWHINHSRLFNAKSSSFIYIEYIWFGLVGFYGISTIVDFFNAKSSLYIYIKYIWFGLVGFYGISTILGYLMPNPLHSYISNIYDLV